MAAKDELVRISVRVVPRSSENAVKGYRDGVLTVKVTEPPVDGAANSSVVQVVSKAIGLRPSAVRVVMGEKQRNKVLEFEGITKETLAARLEAVSGPAT